MAGDSLGSRGSGPSACRLAIGTTVFDLAFSPDGQTLVSNSEERVAVWNVHEGAPLGRWLAIPGDKSTGVALSPDGKTVASINTYGEITLSDAESGRTIRARWGKG